MVSSSARNFVRMYVSQRTGRRYDSLIFSAGPHGKPYIEDCDVHFNLSHCGNLILAAFSQSEIGADIELTGRNGQAVVQRVFTDSEKDYINLAPSERESRRRFGEIWTAKEAFLKLYGVGFAGKVNFAVADRNGLFREIVSPELGSAEVFSRRVNIELNEGDFIPKSGEILQSVETEFQICICGKQLGEISLQILE